jgi:serine/threonine protein kinase
VILVSKSIVILFICSLIYYRKTKGVSNTGQIRSVYKDDEDDELVGLSMERYSFTLKEYAFNTRSPITGEQKFRLIHDMVKGIKSLHDAGFAHRDLSEVNMMVNNTNERLADGSIKPELVVIDFGKAEFINREDVLT